MSFGRFDVQFKKTTFSKNRYITTGLLTNMYARLKGIYGLYHPQTKRQ